MAKFNWLIIAGHGAGDIGATGKVGKYNGVREADKTRELVSLIKKEAQSYDIEVYQYPSDRNAFYDCQKGIFKQILWQYFPGVKFDYAFEVHFNAYNISAHGTECFVIPNEQYITVEQSLMKRMKNHFQLRDNDNIFDGVKRMRFLVINTVYHQLGISGALLETCFIDNEADMNVYEAKKGAIAKDIVTGIAEGWGWKKKTVTTVTPTPKPITTVTSNFKVGEVVTLKTNATTYQGASKGVKIPSGIKGKKYTVQKISSDAKCLLLKEITSWVLASECAKDTPKTQKLYLPSTATRWNVYPLNKVPIIGNECGTLNPSLFGGLTYDILGKPQTNVVTIQTRDYGKVNIYVGPETGATIK